MCGTLLRNITEIEMDRLRRMQCSIPLDIRVGASDDGDCADSGCRQKSAMKYNCCDIRHEDITTCVGRCVCRCATDFVTVVMKQSPVLWMR